MADERPVRGCDVCGQTDDHPRHVIGHPDHGGTVRHMDCCAASGCAVCQATEQRTAGARGGDLLAAIQGGALDGLDV